MAQVIDQVGAGVQVVSQVRAAPTPGQVVVLDESPIVRDGLVANLGGGVGAPGGLIQLFSQPNRGVRVGMRGGFVLNRLGDEIARFGEIAHRCPADVDVGHQVDVAAAGAVVCFAPKAVAVAVPGTVEAGVVHVRRQTGVDGRPHTGVDPALRRHFDVAAEQDPLRTPMGVGVGDEAADPVRSVARLGARVVGVDVLRRDDPGRQPSIEFLVHQRLEAALQRTAGDDHVFVAAIRGQARRARGRGRRR